MNRTAPAGTFIPHPLHDASRQWPETNCYVDLWIELLSAHGAVPEAMLGFCIGQAYEGDQFTFSKPPIEDLRRLYDIDVRELSIWRSLETHARTQVAAGRLFIVEVDAFYLPDTAASTYRKSHSKTTIAIDSLETAAPSCSYWHNAIRGVLAGEDYLGIFRAGSEADSPAGRLPPYVEIANRPEGCRPLSALREIARGLLGRHLERRPRANPFAVWRRDFPEHLDTLLREPSHLHDYAFNFTRLAGANFELLGSHLRWLGDTDLGPIGVACEDIAQTAKVLQFRLARAVTRRRVEIPEAIFDTLEDRHASITDGLLRWAA